MSNNKKEMNAATALYAMAGWLTSLKEPITFSSNHWASPAAVMADEFIKLNGLEDHIDFDSVKTPNDSVIPKAESNPIGERKEDFLMPISYVKKFTPLAIGDVLFYNDGGYEFTLNDDKQAALYNDNDADKYYSILSFADRPNTGEQPVGDDVVVDRVLNSDDGHSANNITCKAGDREWCTNWSFRGDESDIKSWKPNYSALLKQYQAEQVNQDAGRPKEFSPKVLSTLSHEDLLGFAVDMLAQTKYQQGVIDEITSPKTIGAADKPVYTQAIKDAGDHKLGMHYIDNCDHKCELVGINHSSFIGKVLDKEGIHPSHLSVCDSDDCMPIDNRSEDDKAIDHIMNYHNMSQPDAEDFLTDIKADKINGVKWVGE